MDDNEKAIRLKVLREISDELWRVKSIEMCIDFKNGKFDDMILRHDATEILRLKIIELDGAGNEFRRVMKKCSKKF